MTEIYEFPFGNVSTIDFDNGQSFTVSNSNSEESLQGNGVKCLKAFYLT